LSFPLLLAAIALAAAGHSPASAQRWEPPARARFQYQLESSATSHTASGGINVGICRAPVSGGSCIRPQVFDIDLYEDSRISGNDHTDNTL
jgi:hypothetical protein